MKSLIFTVCLLVAPAYAEEKTVTDVVKPAVEKVQEVSDSINQKLAETRDNRGGTQWAVGAYYTPFEMWTLTNYGFSASYNRSVRSTYEFDYTRGSLGFGYFGVDLGELRERRFSFGWRSYASRNSFNFIAAVYYNDLSVHLGNKYLSSVAANQRTTVDIIELKTVGLTWGIGNRWQTKKGYVIGVDWLAINFPLWTVSQKHPFLDASNDQNLKENVEDAFKLLRHIPAIAALKIQLGFSF